MEAAAVAASPWARCTSARPGWGSHPRAMSRDEGLLRAGDVSLVKSDPSELVQRPPELASQVGA